ncbi:MAG TPA: hypothetical protein VKE98_14855 [Gemmataceae bacterium]|nr:hypothetical protein [Gemmataceae bacterium]
MRRKVARWLIECDPKATRQCFAKLAAGTPCECDQCRNFYAAAGQTFPAEFLALLDELGIDPTKPVDLCHYCREPSGLYLTGGWFHFLGSILKGKDAMSWDKETGNGTLQLAELVPGLLFGFTAGLALVQVPFQGLPLLQLEFQTRVPWVLGEPEPPQ